jgi:hypothetical protein
MAAHRRDAEAAGAEAAAEAEGAEAAEEAGAVPADAVAGAGAGPPAMAGSCSGAAL